MRRILPHSRARAAAVDVPTSAMAAASAFLLLRFRLNSTWLVLGGAVAGAIIAP